MGDWKKPFRRLKESLRILYDASSTIHHGIVFSLDKDASQISDVTEMLEPAYSGEKLVRTISIPIEGCASLQHHFFSRDSHTYAALARRLDGLSGWLNQVPDGLLPEFRMPPVFSQADEDMLRWACLLYYLAWEYDEHCLQAEVEHLESAVEVTGFFPWIECPQPGGVDPRSWLIQREGSSERIRECRARFADAKLRFPDTVSAYLTQDLVYSSLSGIDILINIACECESNDASTERPSLSPTKRTGREARKGDDSPGPKRQNVILDIRRVRFALIEHHNLLQDGPPNREPVTQRRLQELLGWSQSHVSRIIGRMYPNGGMAEYRERLTDKHMTLGFLNRRDDGTFTPDGIVNDVLKDD